MNATFQTNRDKEKNYTPLFNKWVKHSLEEELKQNFILRLTKLYGYSLDQLCQKVEIKNRYETDIAI